MCATPDDESGGLNHTNPPHRPIWNSRGDRCESFEPTPRFAQSTRARLTELLVGAGVDEAAQEIKSRGEAAFLIGTMLLVHVLLDVDRMQAIGGADAAR
ncbi:hypothetical protein N8077_03480 [Myxococcota bacterium]|nr:hypothetical protein [Myxococcota bacterium]